MVLSKAPLPGVTAIETAKKVCLREDGAPMSGRRIPRDLLALRYRSEDKYRATMPRMPTIKNNS